MAARPSAHTKTPKTFEKHDNILSKGAAGSSDDGRVYERRWWALYRGNVVNLETPGKRRCVSNMATHHKQLTAFQSK